MSLPRRLVPGRTHSVTRRTVQRCPLLTPRKEVNQILLFTLGVALSRHDVKLHAFMTSPTHHHTTATDGDECSYLSDVLGTFHSLAARGLNAYYGRGENLWCDGSYDNAEVLGENPSIEDQVLYVWTQPVKDGLVERPEDWPGPKFLPEDFGRTITIPRPELAFFGGRRPSDWEPGYPPALEALRKARREERRKTPTRRRDRGRPGARPPKQRVAPPERKERDRRRLPASITIEVVPPPGYEHMPVEEVRAHFRRLLDARVEQILAERRAQGLTRVMGVPAVLAQDPLRSIGDTFPTFGRNPRIACRDETRRIALLAELVNWRRAYRVAFVAWRRGDREVVFPLGAYALPRFHGARVAPAATGPPILD